MKPCSLRDACWAICALLFAAVGAGMVLEASTALSVSHSIAQAKLDSEAWMLNNCRDPVFRSNMRAHTNVCSEVEANARIGPWGAALRDVSLPSIQDYFGTLLVAIGVALSAQFLLPAPTFPPSSGLPYEP